MFHALFIILFADDVVKHIPVEGTDRLCENKFILMHCRALDVSTYSRQVFNHRDHPRDIPVRERRTRGEAKSVVE